MPRFTILYDEPQEAEWFRGLSSEFDDATEVPISDATEWRAVQEVLSYDRPDVVLLDRGMPILAVEETVEVPSGHNVGQRFARIAASAKARVPFLYFCPYVAKKHGGVTAGPRYMNVRLFMALDAMERMTGTAVTTINWPVDVHWEVVRDAAKDADVRDYISTLLAIRSRSKDMGDLNRSLLSSNIHHRMVEERRNFAENSIRRPDQYNSPPPSVSIMSRRKFKRVHGFRINGLRKVDEVVVYKIGMKKIRADPYTGMSMLYRYLYVLEDRRRALILWFPNITHAKWRKVKGNGDRKEVRLYRDAADAILFADALVLRKDI